MKKDDLKKSIEAIEPDNSMETRLKAKITEQKKSKWYSWKTATGIVAAMVAFALIFSFNLPNMNTNLTNETETVTGKSNFMQGFIMVASAAEADEEEKYERLEINDTFPYACSISVVDARNMTEQEKSSFVKQSANYMNERIEELMSECGTGKINTAWSSASSHENIVFYSVYSNSLKIDLKDKEKIESINIKSSSKWGMVEYYDDQSYGIDEESGVVKVCPQGNDITIDIDDYDEKSGRFYWKNSAEMEEALNDNPDIPLSTFKDTVTITVNYKDGKKAVGVIEVAFDDNGNATFTCEDYRYE